MLINKFRGGKRHFELTRTDELPLGTAGFKFKVATVDSEIGSEVLGVLVDTTPFAYQLKKCCPFRLNLQAGAVKTNYGAILFLLWWMPPVTNGEPFCLYEQIMNPSHPATQEMLERLATQSHLHVALVGPGSHLIDLFELKNTFGFSDLLKQGKAFCENCPTVDFAAAKQEFTSNYALNDLLNLEPEGYARAGPR